MANVLLLVSASAIQDGQDLTVINVFHCMGAILQLEVVVPTQTTQPFMFQMDASANLDSLDICAMSRCVPHHALQDMANASLETQVTR